MRRPTPNSLGRSTPRARLWLFRTGAVLGSLVATLVIAEVGLRAFGPEYHQFVNWNLYYYTNPRGYFDVLGTDEDGRTVYGIYTQGEEHPPGRLPDDLDRASEQAMAEYRARDYRVLGLGDSFTLGQGVRYEDIYLRRLEKMFDKAGKPVAIRNAALWGFDLPKIVEIYHAEAAQRRYNLVLYGFVLNDFGLPNMEKIVGSDFIDFNNGGNEFNPWRKRLATLNFVAHAVESARLSRVTTQLYLDAFTGPNAEKGFSQLRQLAADVRRNGSEFVIVLFPLLCDFRKYPFTAIHEELARFCRHEEIPLVDLLPAYRPYRAEDLWVHPVDHHPNEIAHKIAADEVFRFLQKRALLDRIRPSRDRP